MPDWFEGLSKILPGEKLYSDAIAPAAKQVGRLGEDVVKTARLILAPVQALSHLQGRLEAMFERMAQRVPEDRRVEVPPELTGPAIETMRYLDEGGELWHLLEEILTKAFDSGTAGIVHPAFIHIGRQLSPDEIRLVRHLTAHKIKIVDTLDWNATTRIFSNRTILECNLPADVLHLPSQLDLYGHHLISLGLVEWPVLQQEPIMVKGEQKGVRRRSEILLTELGRLFSRAASPPQRSG